MPDPQTTRPAPPDPAAADASGRERIIVVEDDPGMRAAIADILSGHGYRPIVVATGEEALERLDGADLVLLDGMLPGRDGWQICAEIKARYGALLPVLIVTARAEPEAIARTFAVGADDYVAKPFRSAELLARIESRLRVLRAERAVRESAERYRALIERAGDIIVILDADGTITYASPSNEQVIGYPPAELHGRNAFEFVHPDDYAAIHRAYGSLLAAPNQSVTVEFRFRHARGEWRMLQVTGTNLLEDAAVGGVVINARDLTERVLAEDALKRNLAQLQGLARAAVEVSGLRTPEEVAATVSQRAAELLGVERATVALASQREGAAAGDGAAPGPAIALPLVGSDGRDLAVLHLHGITEAELGETDRAVLVQLARMAAVAVENTLLEDQLFQSQKMEIVGKLAGGIAHDFNNLLTVIRGHTALLMQDAAHDSAAWADLQEINRAASRAGELTHQLLAFSRRQVLVPKVVDLNAVVSDMDRMLRRLIGEDIELITILEPELARVRVDPAQLEQVIMNLVVNARDAMPRGGSLFIETANSALDDADVRRHRYVVPGRYVLLTVRDSGHGMSDEVRKRVFEPFFTTKEVGRGTGLGLSTVYGIVKQSGGYIWVDSEEGAGSEFRIFLPRVDAGGVDAEPAHDRSEVPRGRETVLVVEDEDAVRLLARRILQQRGYAVLEAASGEEALRLAREHPGTIHLLLSDVVMPRMSGPAVAEALKRRFPELRVIFISGYTDDAVTRHGMLHSGAQFLQKPFTPERLARLVRATLDD